MKKNIKKIEKPTMVGVGSTAWFGTSSIVEKDGNGNKRYLSHSEIIIMNAKKLFKNIGHLVSLGLFRNVAFRNHD